METNIRNKKYYEEINIMRGCLVFLVVIGHILTQLDYSGSISADIFSIIGSVIYSFHMYAFFFVAGFVSLKAIGFVTKMEKKRYIYGRAKRLLVPYFIMGIIYLPAKLLLSGIARNEYQIHNIWRIIIGDNPDGALWFLYILFLINVIICFFVNEKNLKFAIVISIVFCVLSSFISFRIAAINHLFEFTPYFLFGILARTRYKDIKILLCDRNCIAIAFVIFSSFNVILYVIPHNFFIIFTSITGTMLLLTLSIKISSKHKSWDFYILRLLGNYSMDIYIFSEPIKVIIRTWLKNVNSIAYMSCCVIASIVLPIVISKLFVRNNKIFRVLLLGMDRNIQL